jgi:hypothetical protein
MPGVVGAGPAARPQLGAALALALGFALGAAFGAAVEDDEVEAGAGRMLEEVAAPAGVAGADAPPLLTRAQAALCAGQWATWHLREQ